MQKIVLISCVSKKLSKRAKARELYISPLFKYYLKYAKSLDPSRIFILSAEYGLVDLEEKIDPYDKTLNKMKAPEREEWAQNVINQLKERVNLKDDKIIFLAGKRYREHLVKHMSNYEIPLEGLGIGKQLKYLKENA